MNHTIHNSSLTVSVSDLGAELQSIRGQDGTEYLWQADPTYWPARAPILFPFVARLVQGKYSLDGNVYELPIHGFAQYRTFTIPEHTDTRLVLELVSDADTLQAYPREFSLRIVYELQGSTLAVEYVVENRDPRTMYFGIGGHPGFQVPLRKDLHFEDYRLRFLDACQPERVGFTEDCFVTGQATPYPLENGCMLPLCHNLFDEDAVVLQNMCRAVVLESPLDTHSVTVSFPDMPYLGIWHMPKMDAPYVCIEPWRSLPAKAHERTVFEEKSDLVRLEPGQTYRNRWTISLT